MYGKCLSIREVTIGFAEDQELRLRYEREGFGLYAVFERPEWAEEQSLELQREFLLCEEDIRLVQHISTPETGSRSTWEIYIRAGKGIRVLFLQRSA
ncbi:MAG TPA: hypothetical protein PLQ00_15355 [Thermoguttaceae bacterium]|nr:hypothetical protein [Thermoguttaceae bacterium]